MKLRIHACTLVTLGAYLRLQSIDQWTYIGYLWMTTWLATAKQRILVTDRHSKSNAVAWQATSKQTCILSR